MNYKDFSEVQLWFKLQGESVRYSLADIPELIPYRWSYFRDNWDFLKSSLFSGSDIGDNSNLNSQVKKMDSFVATRRSFKSNPFSSQQVIFDFIEIFSIVGIDITPLNSTETEILNKKLARIRSFNKQNFIDFRDSFTKDFLILSDKMGLSDSTANSLYNRSPVPKEFEPQISLISSTQDLAALIKSLDFVIANYYKETEQTFDPFAVAKTNINNPQIPVDSYSSAYLGSIAPGKTLQEIAAAYLGDPNKYLEIAIANNLKPPYIDEVGETIPLNSNGNLNKINLPQTFGGGTLTSSKVHQGQVILLRSSTLKKNESRTILNIQTIPVSGELVLELDGPSDLQKYKISENATITAFKPNTTNSNFLIFIPSKAQTRPTDLHETPWFMKNLDQSSRQGGVDFKINPFGDLVFDNTNDAAYSYGLENAIQALKIKFNVERGELPGHRNFGLIPVTGQSLNNFQEIQSFLSQQIVDQVLADDRFSGVQSISVSLLEPFGNQTTGRAISVQMAVRMAGSDGAVIPLTFTTNFK
jgi:hypothetical protein